MSKSKIVIRISCCLLLMLLLPPERIYAQNNSQAVLNIEKTDGSVVKIPITQGYPLLKHSYRNNKNKMIPALEVVYGKGSSDSYSIDQSEIKRFYTTFEATGIVEKKTDAESLTEKVYTLDGKAVGNGSRTLEGQPQGLYIVKKGANYKKIVKP